jgi:hypothetical protein
MLAGAPLAANEHNYPTRKANAERQAATPRAVKADVVRVVPHMAVNEAWVSELWIRSDSEFVIDMILEFYDQDGFPVTATFFDSFGDQYEGAGFAIPDLQPFEIYAIDFDSLSGGARNLQVHVLSDETQQAYGLEGAYYRFQGGQKVSSVGVPVEAPGDTFIINLDQRFDPITGNRRFRGLAISNADGLDCQCTGTLFNRFGNDLDALGNPYPQVTVSMPGLGKWVGDIYQLYPNIDNFLEDGLGYLYFECDNPAAVLALSFEFNTPIVTSVSVDYFVFTKNKDGEKVRVKRQ